MRWVIRDFSGIGERPGFAIDDIFVCSAVTTPFISVTGPSAFCAGSNATYNSAIRFYRPGGNINGLVSGRTGRADLCGQYL